MKISKVFLGFWIAVIIAFIVVLIITTSCDPVPATNGIPKVPLDTTIICNIYNNKNLPT